MAETSSISSLAYPFINFSILVGALYFFLKTPIKSFAKGRHDTLKEQLESVQNKLIQAQNQYQEYSQRLSSVDAEVAALIKQIRSDAESTKVKAVTEARRMADQIIIDSKHTAEGMMGEFKMQVRADVANLIISRTEHLLKERMTGDVRELLKKNFSKQMESGR